MGTPGKFFTGTERTSSVDSSKDNLEETGNPRLQPAIYKSDILSFLLRHMPATRAHTLPGAPGRISENFSGNRPITSITSTTGGRAADGSARKLFDATIPQISQTSQLGRERRRLRRENFDATGLRRLHTLQPPGRRRGPLPPDRRNSGTGALRPEAGGSGLKPGS